jgi:hypothetical protein
MSVPNAPPQGLLNLGPGTMLSAVRDSLRPGFSEVLALNGNQPMRNVPGAAAAPATARVDTAQQLQPHPPPRPGPWQYFKYDTPQMLQAYINATYEEDGPRYSYDTETNSKLYLNSQMDVLLTRFNDYIVFKDIKFPPVKYLNLQGIKKLESLKYFSFPDSLTELVVMYTGVNSLVGVKFPPNLIRLRLDHNQINSLDGVEFPFGLQNLDLTHNQIKSLNGVKFPPNLTYLGLSNNNITSLLGAHFPPNLTRLSLGGNPISSLKGIIDPSPNVIQLLGEVLPTQFNYFREKSEAKAARQSQKATLKEMSDLSQQSMRFQMHAVTSFLREGMEARAQQHAEQLLRDRQEKPTTYEQSLFYVKLGEKTYPVPMIEELSIHNVLNYLNEHYYISVLHNCGGMHLHKGGSELESGRTLKECGVVSDDVLHIQCESQKGGFARSKKHIKRYKKSKSKKNGHKRK